MHKGFSPLFKPNTPDTYKDVVKENLGAKFDHLSKALEGRDYLMGSFTVADAYLYAILTWAKPMGRYRQMADLEGLFRPYRRAARGARGTRGRG